VTETEIQSAYRKLNSRAIVRKRHVIFSAALVLVVLLLCLAGYLRPAARLNRLLTAVGSSRLPNSTENLTIERQDRALGIQRIYVRFNATPDDIADFLDRSPVDVNDAVPMATLHFGPKAPSWMRWGTPDGRVYHFKGGEASFWLAIDDSSNTVYMCIFEVRPAWLRQLLEYLTIRGV